MVELTESSEPNPARYVKTNIVEAWRETITPENPTWAVYLFKDHPKSTNRVMRYEFGIRDGTNEVQVWAVEQKE